MFAAADYPFLNILWSMILFFAWVIWVWMVIGILTDVFRRDDIGGGGKALWCVFVILLPFVGVLIYLVTQNDGMARRTIEHRESLQARFDDYARSTVSDSGPSAEIEKAKGLLDAGTIDRAEFEKLKARAIGST